MGGWRRWVLLVAGGLGILAAGCSTTSAPKVDVPDDGVRDESARAALLTRLPALLEARAAIEARPAHLPTEIEALKGELHQPRAIEVLYAETGHQRFMLDQAGMTPVGERIFATLRDSGAEALDPRVYHAPRVSMWQIQAEEQAAQLRQHLDAVPEVDQALASLWEQRTDWGDDEAIDALLGGAQGEVLRAWLAEHARGMEALSALRARAEIALADGLLRYAYDMKHANVLSVPEEIMISKGKQGVIEERQLGFFRMAREAAMGPRAADAVGGLLEGLRPIGEDYRRLMEALARYAAIDAAGGWPLDLPSIKPPKRREATRYTAASRDTPAGVVKQIKARLSGERLYEGTIDDQWDEALSAAIQRYRRGNLLSDEAVIDYEMIQVMSAPSAFRLAQIKINLQRLREGYRGEGYAIYVNVPEFVAEVWDEGQVKMRFNIVVGSRKKYLDRETGQWRFPDATPLFRDKMERVVFNPYWNVPARIQREIMRKAEEDPEYLEQHKYEVVEGSNGHESIRQKPGFGNALGQVKFLFPNQHDVYMHDTPSKDLFKTRVRAYSHGCMRVQEPLDLAAFVLQRDDPTWTPQRVRKAASGGSSYNVDLNDGPEIHIDYVTTKVEDEGSVIFLWDIYHRDIALAAERHGVVFEPTAHYP